MTYEVEVRSKLSFFQKLRLLRFLRKNSKLIGKHNFRTILFSKPRYLRIRYEIAGTCFVVTTKKGKPNAAVRIENNKEVSLAKLGAFLRDLQSSGFNECCAFQTSNESFLHNGVTIHVSTHQGMGTIFEAECIVRDKRKLRLAEQQVKQTVVNLKLKIIDPQHYKVLMDKLFIKKSTRISKLAQFPKYN
jgi:adenylate cyclase class IV